MKFKKAVVSLWILALAALVLSTFIAFKSRPYLYMVYQHVSYGVGFNVNNISTDNYVSFIKAQNGSKLTQSSGSFLNRKFDYDEFGALEARVLGENEPSAQKLIEVDLSEQRLYMKENGSTIGSFLVSTGKWAPTPTGSWPIWTKLRYARMTGGTKELGTFYDLPNVPYTMYFYQGYGIHGAYWHNNFGNPMSHGCVNMRPEEAGIVFNWADVGTTVTVRN